MATPDKQKGSTSLIRAIRTALDEELPGAGRYSWIAIGLVWASVIAVVVAILGALWFAINFQRPLGSGENLSEWAGFATFMSFVAQALIGGATLAVVILVSGVLARRLDRQKSEEQRSRELVRLSEKMVDTEFYLKVMYPSWEVALKWMDPDLPDGDRYRADVVGAELRLPKNYSRRSGDKPLAEGSPRMHPHFRPYDIPSRGKTAVITELSESLAFATWVRFWRNVKFLIDREIINATDARHLFREWYMWWAPFMTEFAAVCVEVMDRLKAKYGYVPNQESWQQSSILKLQELHADFEIYPHCGHPPEKFEGRIAQIADRIMIYVDAALDAAGNPHIDGTMPNLVPCGEGEAAEAQPRG